MGRPYTGTATVYSAPRLELSRLRKARFFTESAQVSGAWSWSNGDEVMITTRNQASEVYMELTYTWTHPHSGITEDVRQRIELVRLPSNLGRGHVLYFRCPTTYRLCRVLYRAYHSKIFKSRNAFSYRLYYPTQVCGKKDRWNEQYWQAERVLESMKRKRRAGTYHGQPTKRALRESRVIQALVRADELRWSAAAWPKRLARELSRVLYP